MKNIKVLTVLLIVLFVASVGFSEVRKTYYESGALKDEVTFKNDKKEGLGKTYYENGNLQTEISYKNGKLDGPYKVYYESGVFRAEGIYKNDKKEGLYREFYENGVIRFIDTYENGQKINRKAYNKRGKLEFNKDYPYIEKN